MILKKVTASDGTVTYTETGEDTILANAIDGLKAPVLAEGEYLSSKAAFWGTVAYSAASVAVGSVVARKRLAAGAQPMLKVFF